jgi:hypothetical protein
VFCLTAQRTIQVTGARKTVRRIREPHALNLLATQLNALFIDGRQSFSRLAKRQKSKINPIPDASDRAASM